MKASERNVQGTDERSIGGNVVAKEQIRPKINKLAWTCFVFYLVAETICLLHISSTLQRSITEGGLGIQQLQICCFDRMVE